MENTPQGFYGGSRGIGAMGLCLWNCNGHLCGGSAVGMPDENASHAEYGVTQSVAFGHNPGDTIVAVSLYSTRGCVNRRKDAGEQCGASWHTPCKQAITMPIDPMQLIRIRIRLDLVQWLASVQCWRAWHPRGVARSLMYALHLNNFCNIF